MNEHDLAIEKLWDLGINVFPGKAGEPVIEADFGRSMASDEQVEPVFNLPELKTLLLDLTRVTDKTVARLGVFDRCRAALPPRSA
ncbi:MAG TPA: hypothetical protein VKE98_19950 [Gemmataceae bacterium]|nr:hypothetical protein [Gemmataceae bacterium]